MKKRWISLLLGLLLIGCTIPKDEEPVAAGTESSGIRTENQTALESASVANTPEIPFEWDGFDASMVSDYTDATAPSKQEITLCRVSEENGVYFHTYYAKKLDATDLQMEVLSFDPLSEAEALHLLVKLPEAWDRETIDWLAKEGLALQFEIDGQQADAFRERYITAVDHEIDIMYRRCILDRYALSHDTLSIRPYVLHYTELMTNEPANGWYKSVSITETKTLTTRFAAGKYASFNDRIIAATGEQVFFDHAAKSIRLHRGEHTVWSRPPYQYNVFFMDVDYEATDAAGLFEGSGDGKYQIGTVYRKDMDLQDAALVLNSFHIWDEEVLLSFSWRFPESWTDRECLMAALDDLRFIVYLDDERPNAENAFALEAVEQPFGTGEYVTFDSVKLNDAFFHSEMDNYRTMYRFRTSYYLNWHSNLTVEQWETHHSLTILPYLIHRLDNPNGESIEDYLKYNQPKLLAPDGTPYDSLYYLYELALTIDLTPDLFENGF